MAADDALKVVQHRFEFYRDNYRRVVMALLLMILVVFILIGFIYVQKITQPKPQYFATRSDGSIIRLTPLSVPNLRDPALIQWAATAAVSTYTFGFNDWRSRLQALPLASRPKCRRIETPQRRHKY